MYPYRGSIIAILVFFVPYYFSPNIVRKSEEPKLNPGLNVQPTEAIDSPSKV